MKGEHIPRRTLYAGWKWYGPIAGEAGDADVIMRVRAEESRYNNSYKQAIKEIRRKKKNGRK